MSKKGLKSLPVGAWLCSTHSDTKVEANCPPSSGLSALLPDPRVVARSAKTASVPTAPREAGPAVDSQGSFRETGGSSTQGQSSCDLVGSLCVIICLIGRTWRREVSFRQPMTGLPVVGDSRVLGSVLSMALRLGGLV